MDSIEIRRIDSEDTLEIRHKVMWPHKSIDFVRVEEDEKGLHFGAFVGDKHVAVISLFIEGDNAQFRKFATLEEYQTRGIGTKLLEYTIEYARKAGAERIWCNARENKSSFYERFGLLKSEETFFKEDVKYVIMELTLNKDNCHIGT